ncbi:hypothetical protein [Nannocystis pusilla]
MRPLTQSLPAGLELAPDRLPVVTADKDHAHAFAITLRLVGRGRPC